MSNGRFRNISINSDYLLVVPSKTNKNENYYFFSYADKEKSDNNFIKLNVHSAFADCVDLTQGQERPMTILKEVKYNAKTKEEQTLYIHPRYSEKK